MKSIMSFDGFQVFLNTELWRKHGTAVWTVEWFLIGVRPQRLRLK